MKNKLANNDEIVEAIQDLTRIFLAANSEFSSKSEIIRRLNNLSIPPSRIARLLGMQVKDVTSAISKGKKTRQKNKVVEQTSPDDVDIEAPETTVYSD